MQKKIMDLIGQAYKDAAAVAELNEVEIEDFRLWVSQGLLSVFCAVNEVGRDNIGPNLRAALFRQSLDGFCERALALYAESLATEIEEKNHLRAVDRKP